MNVFAVLKRLEHHRVLRDVREQAQLELGIIGGDDLVSFSATNARRMRRPSSVRIGMFLQIRLRSKTGDRWRRLSG